jgi:heterodisulfide reductase subunit A
MLLNGALPLADITIYYMDIRTFGKGYEQFYQNAKAMGVEFVRGKVASISEDEDQNPVVTVEITELGQIVERTHDLVVLSLGMIPAKENDGVFGISISSDGFISIPSPNSEPCMTDKPGIFAAGAAVGPMDIVDSIITASAAASAASSYIHEQSTHLSSSQMLEEKLEKVYA